MSPGAVERRESNTDLIDLKLSPSPDMKIEPWPCPSSPCNLGSTDPAGGSNTQIDVVGHEHLPELSESPGPGSGNVQRVCDRSALLSPAVRGRGRSTSGPARHASGLLDLSDQVGDLRPIRRFRAHGQRPINKRLLVGRCDHNAHALSLPPRARLER